MNGINPYGSQFLNLLGGGNTPSGWSQSGQITSVPNDLKSLAINVILKGQVTANQQNGNTIISTPRGDVGVKFQNPPPVGARVDVQITAGSPPTNAYARPTLVDAVQTQQAQQPQSQPSPTVQNTVAQNSQAVQNPNIFEEVQSLQSTKQTAAIKTVDGTQIPQPPLQVGQAVRLSPLPVAQQSFDALIQNFIAARQVVTTTTQTALSNQVIQSAISLLPSTQPTNPNVIPNTTAPISLPNTATSTFTTPPRMIVTTPLTASTALVQSPPVTLPNGQVITPQAATQPIIMQPSQIGLPQTIMALPQPQITTPAGQVAMGDGRIYRIDVQTTNLTPTVQANSAQGAMPSTPPSLPQPILQTQTNINAGQITAVATGFTTSQGNPIVQIAPLFTDAQPQLMVMNYPARNMPAGTRITLTPIAGQSTMQTVSMNSTATPTTQTGWPTTLPQFFNESMMMPALAQTLLNIMPSATQTRQFPAAALLFLAAAKNGDLSGWLGQRPIRGIEANGSEALKKLLQTLSTDMASMATKSAGVGDPPMIQGATDWRGYLLPLLFGAGIDQATLWVKDNADDNANDMDEQKKKGTRFVVDLELSRMGNVQFDGYIQPHKQTFDLALHTQRPFTRDVQNHITGLWTKTLDGMGLSGSMVFKDIKIA